MLLSQFDFDLPSDLIAQYPRDQRDESRLMVVDRKTEEISEVTFRDLSSFLEPQDTLIFNDTKVFPARLIGQKENGVKVELLLVKELSKNTWEVLAKPGKKIKEGSKLLFSSNLKALVIRDFENSKVVKFETDNLMQELDRIGIIPLPPYIKREKPDPNDRVTYQTVYAQNRGSIAAPTAGLHFTANLLQKLKEKGVHQEMLTLHVGLGTFQPIFHEKLSDHQMHEESFIIPKETLKRLNEKRGRRICVGTTTLRALESSASANGILKDSCTRTDIFIQPGYTFKYVEHLLTNFHLPKSTLFILISAFMGESLAKKAYEIAVQKGFKFFSYGDAMLIL